MGESAPARIATPARTRLKTFGEVVDYLDQQGSYAERIVYPHLQCGDFYWIPDVDTGFGAGDCHPWVITVPYRPDLPTVTVSPRTSRRAAPRGAQELFIPADIVGGLDRDGIVLLGVRRPLLADDFRHYKYIGRLPDEWRARLQAAIFARAASIARMGEG